MAKRESVTSSLTRPSGRSVKRYHYPTFCVFGGYCAKSQMTNELRRSMLRKFAGAVGCSVKSLFG